MVSLPVCPARSPWHNMARRHSLVVDVAAGLIAKHGWFDPDTARGQCGHATYLLGYALADYGHVRVWTDYGLGPDQYGHRQAEHNAALIDGTVYDLTAVQFDSEAPVIWRRFEWFEWAAGCIAGEAPVIAEDYGPDDRLRKTWREL